MSRGLCLCGHQLALHERVTGTHAWVCHAEPVEGGESCGCGPCGEKGAPPRCACMVFRAVAAGPAPAGAAA